LSSSPLTATALDLRWRESSSNDANGGFPGDGPGGTVEWVVYRARGLHLADDAGGSSVVAVVPVGDVTTTVRVTGLRRDATYTFGVRGRDQEGNLSPWSERIATAARRPGLYLAGGGLRQPDRAPEPGARQPLCPRGRCLVCRSAAGRVAGGVDRIPTRRPRRSGRQPVRRPVAGRPMAFLPAARPVAIAVAPGGRTPGRRGRRRRGQ
jgi:hypothetical protein